MDVQFIEYNGNQIMYEPTSKKYYANDVEFDSLLKAKKFLDSGKMSRNIRGAYRKGLFAQGGQTEEKFYAHIKHGIVPIQSVSLWKNRRSTQEPSKENILEFLNNVPIDERICIYDSNVKSIDGELHSAKTPLYTNGAEAVSKIVDEKENIIWEKSSHNNSFAKGGEVVQLPPKGELTNRDNLLLKYQKVGSNYEFYVYEPISKEVSGYNQIKFVCKNSDCALKMNYKEFINYLYSELYLDDKKYAKGGKIGFEGLANKVAKRYVGRKVSKEYQAEYGKTYDAKEAKEVGNKVAGKVYQQQVAKKKIVRKLQRKTN
jgi:hypothetical protein